MRAVAIVHFAQVRRAGQNVVARVERVLPEREPGALARPGSGHKLHETHRSCSGDGPHPARTFGADHRIDPVLGNAELLRCFADMRGNLDALRSSDKLLRLRKGLRRTHRQHGGQESLQKIQAEHGISPLPGGARRATISGHDLRCLH